MAKYLVVCDLSWMMYRAYYTYTPDKFFYYRQGQRTPNGHIYGVIRMIFTLKKRFGDVDIVLCKDGVPKERIELMGGTVTEQEDGKLKIDRGMYKEGREQASYSVHRDASDICKYFSAIPFVYYAYDKFKESDDLMFALSRNLEDKYEKVFIFSGDNDLLQSINEKTFLIRSLAKDAIILDDYWVQMESDYRIPAHCLPIFRSMRGDVSDNIEGIYPRLSKDFARYVATHFDTIEDIQWYYPTSEDPYKMWWERIKTPKALKILERNYKLMKLNAFPVTLQKSGVSKKEAQDYLLSVNIPSYAKYFS